MRKVEVIDREHAAVAPRPVCTSSKPGTRHAYEPAAKAPGRIRAAQPAAHPLPGSLDNDRDDLVAICSRAVSIISSDLRRRSLLKVSDSDVLMAETAPGYCRLW